MTSLAITDHGVLYGAIQFYQAAKDAGIKPILGCEIYIAPRQPPRRAAPAIKSNSHMVLLAKNQTGWHNLIQLITKAHLEGYLLQTARGQRASAAAPRRPYRPFRLSGRRGAAALSLQGGLRMPEQAARWYKETFEDFYFEIQRQPDAELERVNQELVPSGP